MTGKLVYEQCCIVLAEIDRLRELVIADARPSGGLRLGVTQGVGDLALRGTLDALSAHYPGLSTTVITGWGQQMVEAVHNGELDAAAVWLPVTAVLPKKVSGRKLHRTRLVVVAPRDEVTRRSYRLAEWHERGWVLNPDGCGFRASLGRTLAAQGLPLIVRLDTNGWELQLELVARGHGLGLVPMSLLERSAQRGALAIVPIADFKPEIDLWLVHRSAMGRLQPPVERFGDVVAHVFEASPRQARAS